jgi:hypothetical protein
MPFMAAANAPNNWVSVEIGVVRFTPESGQSLPYVAEGELFIAGEIDNGNHHSPKSTPYIAAHSRR